MIMLMLFKMDTIQESKSDRVCEDFTGCELEGAIYVGIMEL